MLVTTAWPCRIVQPEAHRSSLKQCAHGLSVAMSALCGHIKLSSCMAEGGFTLNCVAVWAGLRDHFHHQPFTLLRRYIAT